MHAWTIAILVGGATIAIALPLRAGSEAPAVLNPWQAGIGRLIADAKFTDLAGKPGSLAEVTAAPFTVFAMTNTTCPLCNKFAQTLVKLEAEFAPRGVAFVFVNANEKDDVKAPPFKGRYVKSEALAQALGATSTTEVLVIDSKRTLVYRGCVDDQYGQGYSNDAPKHEYLKHALTHLLAGKTPDVQATTAPGCALDISKSTMTTSVTYHNRISRIMNAHCVECHRAGGVGPFALTSHDDVKANKGEIRRQLEKGTMPPWFAAATVGKHEFINDPSLPAADKTALLDWLKTDMPVGDASDAPAPRTFPAEWAIGKPDAIVQLPKPINIKADGVMNYVTISVDTNFDDDRWVQALELQPTGKGVVHHILVHVIPKNGGLAARLPGGAFRIRDDVDDERSGYFAAYVPGNSHVIYPDGQAKRLPKGAKLRFQMHYTPNGKATTDQTRLGLIFAKAPPIQELKVAGIANVGIRIPAGADNHKEVAKMKIPHDITLTAIMPHMHVRGKACRYELTTPDGKTVMLMDSPHYDFNWQLRYQFATPKAVPKGSTLTFTAWYDNSTKNAANPDPKKTVMWGQQTYDEMMLGYIEYTTEKAAKNPDLDEEDVKVPEGGYAIPEAYKALLKKYDTTGDGKLDAKEIDAMPEKMKVRVLEYIRRKS